MFHDRKNSKNNRWKRAGAAMLAMTLGLGATACGPSGQADETKPCPDENRVLLDGNKYCVIGQNIIEKGFICPSDLSYRHEVPGTTGVVCSNQSSLPVGDIDPLQDLVKDPPGTGVWINEPDPEPIACGEKPPVTCNEDSDCTNGQFCEIRVDTACVPSSCSCDETTGTWVCTEDCNLAMGACVSQSSCPLPSPADAGCDTDAECGSGEACVVQEDECKPGSCACNSVEGGWACTADCQPVKACEAVDPVTVCGERPAVGCYEDAGCGSGEICKETVTTDCVSSGCTCDEATGAWVCTADCAPGRCVPEPEQCGDGSALICDIDGDPACPAGLVREIIGGCYGACVDPQTCQSPVQMCNGQPDPSYRECTQDSDCTQGYACTPSAAQVCVPSSCFCDPAGGWACTEDCGTLYSCQPEDPQTPPCNDGSPILCDAVAPVCPVGQIVKVANGCFLGCVDPQTCESPVEVCNGMADPSYQPCSQDADCGAGKACVPSDDQVCIPSACSCEPTGGWVCTEDCGTDMICVTVP